MPTSPKTPGSTGRTFLIGFLILAALALLLGTLTVLFP